MKLTSYNIGCGDCIRLEYVGESGKVRNLLVDAGFERTFRDILFNELSRIVRNNNKVDLWVITHIHDDHIGGAVSYAAAVTAEIQQDVVVRWWYNPPRIPSLLKGQKETSQAMSIGQSDKLANFLLDAGSLPNVNIFCLNKKFDLDGLQISVLSPDRNALSALSNKYRDPKISLEFSEENIGFEAKAPKLRDYHIRARDFDFSSWKQDNNLENASSIVLLLEKRNSKVLLLADSHPSIVVSSLNRMGYSETQKLECDLVKVSHHGSLGNNSAELYSMISCSSYLITCDDINNYGLAQKACLVRILTAPGRDFLRRYFFYFSSGGSLLKNMFQIDGQEIFTELNFELVFPLDGLHSEIVI